MIVPRMVRYFLFICFAALLSPAETSAHGGVVEEDDLCLIKVSFLSAHFKIYQPESSGHEQFCEDLPVASESIFVMEYQHDLLAEMPVDFRIVRDVTGKGRFARMEDVEAIENLDAVTVFYQSALIEPDVYTVNYDFQEEGDFIGIVSATHQETGKVYAAVFPFEVGFTGLGYWPFFIGLLVLIQIQYLFMSGRIRRWFSSQPAVAALLIVVVLSQGKDAFAAELVISYSTPEGKPTINQMQTWVLHIETDDGLAVEDALITVEGGMPKHDHGLPTRPRITEELGGGDYKLQGLRFHMSGYWELTVIVTTDEGVSTVVIPVQL